MKRNNGLIRLWISAVGSVCALLGLAGPGAAAIPPEGAQDPGVEPKNRVARPEPSNLKARAIAFEDAAGAKNRGAIAQEPDGRFRGVIAQAGGKAREVIESPRSIPRSNGPAGTEIPVVQAPPKDKGLPPTPAGTEVPAVQAPPPPKEKACDEFTVPATKDKAVIDPGQGKGHFIPPPPPKEKACDEFTVPATKDKAVIDPGQGKGHFIPPPPPKEKACDEFTVPATKDKAVIDPGPAEKSRLPAVQTPPQPKEKSFSFDRPPSRDEAIDQQLLTPPAPQAPAPGPQSLRPGIDYSLLLTQVQKDHVVMGTRDRHWTPNPEGKLERRLAGGARAVMQEGGWVEVYSAEGHLLSAYQDIRAERIDQATRLAAWMKQAVLKVKG